MSKLFFGKYYYLFKFLNIFKKINLIGILILFFSLFLGRSINQFLFFSLLLYFNIITCNIIGYTYFVQNSDKLESFLLNNLSILNFERDTLDKLLDKKYLLSPIIFRKDLFSHNTYFGDAKYSVSLSFFPDGYERFIGGLPNSVLYYDHVFVTDIFKSTSLFNKDISLINDCLSIVNLKYSKFSFYY